MADTIAVIKANGTTGSFESLVKQALTHRLYVPGWMMNGWLHRMKDEPHPMDRIALVYKNNVPVAAAILYKEWTLNRIYLQTSTFVRSTERRKGYGSLAMNAIKNDYDKTKARLLVGCGIYGSMQFYQTLGLR